MQSIRFLRSLDSAIAALLSQALYVLDGQVLVRPETENDWTAVHALNASAFETQAEANLVDSLRNQVVPVISLVAVEEENILGHIMFSPVFLTGCPDINMTGLAPMPVIPELQGKGIGSALVKEGLERCRQLGIVAVAVLGHPEYYPRFGFKSSLRFEITSECDVPEGVFMLLEMLPNALAGKVGTVNYHATFNNV